MKRTNTPTRGDQRGHAPHQNPNRRSDFLAFIAAFIAENHYAPTVRELGEHFDVSLATVKHYLNDLRDRGELNWAEGKQRTLHLTSNGAPAGVSETRRETECDTGPAPSRRSSPSPSAPRRASVTRKQATTTEA